MPLMIDCSDEVIAKVTRIAPSSFYVKTLLDIRTPRALAATYVQKLGCASAVIRVCDSSPLGAAANTLTEDFKGRPTKTYSTLYGDLHQTSCTCDSSRIDYLHR